jgi:hypothetical protein
MPRIKWDGDASSAVRAQEALTAAQAKYTAESTKSTQSAKSLEAQAKRLTELVNPQEKFNNRMKQLSELTDKGKISIDNATKATILYQKELNAAEQAGRKGFDPGIVTRMIGPIGSVAGAVGFATAAFKIMQDRAQAAANAVIQSLGAVGELQQLGPEGFARGLSISRRLTRSGAVSDPSQATDIASNLINSGLPAGEVDFLVDELAAKKVIAPGNLNQVGGDLSKIKNLFGGNIPDIAGKALNAANATQANLSQTVNELLKFAVPAQGSGVSFEEALAAFEVTEQRSANPDAAAELLKSFFVQVKNRNLAKGDIQGTVANIRSKIKPGGTAADVLHDANAVSEFELLEKNLPQLTRREDEIGKAKYQSTNLLFNDPLYGAAAVASIEAGRLADRERADTRRENLNAAALSALRARDIERGTNPVSRFVYDIFDSVANYLNFDNGTIQGAVNQARSGELNLAPETLKNMEGYLRDIKNSNRSKAATLPE